MLTVIRVNASSLSHILSSLEHHPAGAAGIQVFTEQVREMLTLSLHHRRPFLGQGFDLALVS